MKVLLRFSDQSCMFLKTLLMGRLFRIKGLVGILNSRLGILDIVENHGGNVT
jgi:hypothetical protein